MRLFRQIVPFITSVVFILNIGCANAQAQSASSLEIVNNSAALTTNFANNVFGAGRDFDIGSLHLNLTPGYQAKFNFSLFGTEASFRNIFRVFSGSEPLSFSSYAPIGTAVTAIVGQSGLLDFAFQSNAVGSYISNQANHVTSRQQFGISLDSNGLGGYLLFDDRAPSRPDRDYDDMVIRFDTLITPVPEASALNMLLLGSLGLAFMLKRKRPLH